MVNDPNMTRHWTLMSVVNRSLFYLFMDSVPQKHTFIMYQRVKPARKTQHNVATHKYTVRILTERLDLIVSLYQQRPNLQFKG